MLDMNENVLVLYVGDSAKAEALQVATGHRGWYVRHAGDLMTALGIYVIEMPHLILLEDAPEWDDYMGDVYLHLRSVDAAPMILLTDTPHLWARPTDQSVYHLPLALQGASLAYALTHIADVPVSLPR